MNIPIWVAEQAAWFWSAAGKFEPFPRKLIAPIADSVPLTVVFPPRPTIASILGWLRRNGVACSLAAPDRPLRACLVARGGHGFAFIDGTDSEDEQRFSLAHELAHFLRDYLFPRRRAARSLGLRALEVLDGDRPPSADERVSAVLSGTALGYHIHFMDRDLEGGSGPPRLIADAENHADRLAYELLAPADDVWSSIVRAGGSPSGTTIVGLLQSRYGLPARQAGQYAGLLAGPPRHTDPLLRGLASGC